MSDAYFNRLAAGNVGGVPSGPPSVPTTPDASSGIMSYFSGPYGSFIAIGVFVALAIAAYFIWRWLSAPEESPSANNGAKEKQAEA